MHFPGRKLGQTPLNSKVSSAITLSHSVTSSFPAMKEEKTRWRVQIGSTPPRCERRCDSCGHCEAIQVPTNPHAKNSKPSSEISVVMDGRDYGNSNYKPMSWKCKCGNLFFNPWLIWWFFFVCVRKAIGGSFCGHLRYFFIRQIKLFSLQQYL